MRNFIFGFLGGVGLEAFSVLVIYGLISTLSSRYIDSAIFLVYVPVIAGLSGAVAVAVGMRAYWAALGVVIGVVFSMLLGGLLLHGA
jgi:hypothetical protein